MSRYRADYEGLRELMRGPEMQAVMREVAEKGRVYAESIAPVGPAPHDKHPGKYRASFEVTVTADGGVRPPGARAEAHLSNTADYAATLEVSNGAWPPYEHGEHVLGRTLGAMGGL